jgi:predicted O-methyltransferase YrrM
MYRQKRLQHIVVDSTGAYTDLCELGRLACTDKSPYGQHEGHRHPYTAVYSMLFAPLKNKEIQFAEIGVAGGASAIVWWNYFAKARLCLFDRDQNFLDNVGKMEFPEKKPYLGLIDVRVDGDTARALTEAGGLYDVVLDDSSHDYADQIRISKEAWPLIKSGGYMIVEDIYRTTPEADYERDLDSLLNECSAAYFILCNHEERYSPGWNNDKILVLVKA